MAPITIDLSEVIKEFTILSDHESEFSSFILDKITQEIAFKWEDLVGKELHSTRNEYKKAMAFEKIDDRNAVFTLLPTESNLALSIEDGKSSFDMKEGFAKSQKRHQKEDGGWYLTIPYRFATTEALAESMVFANQMPKPIQNIAKQNDGAPITPSQLPKEYQVLGVNPTSGYKHKTSIYVGLKRNQLPNENRGVYNTFRRVSDNTDEGAW